MVKLPISQGGPGRARAWLCGARARLRRALVFRGSDAQAELLNKIVELKREISSNVVKYNEYITFIRAETEKEFRTAEEERAALAREIEALEGVLELRDSALDPGARRRSEADQQTPAPAQLGYKEALLSSEAESLRAVLELGERELSEERRSAERLRQAGTDLASALQRARVARARADRLGEELQRELGDEAILIDKNKYLEDEYARVSFQARPC